MKISPKKEEQFQTFKHPIRNQTQRNQLVKARTIPGGCSS
jgi:protein involved in temperature-dependent protein secretion